MTNFDYRVADDSGIPVPSRFQIIGYLTEVDQSVSVGQLCRHFGIEGGAAQHAITGRIHRLKRLGVVTEDSNHRLRLQHRQTIMVGSVIGHPSGYGFVRPDNGGNDIYLSRQQMLRTLHGDTVLIKLQTSHEIGVDKAVIIEVKINPEREIIGCFSLVGEVGSVVPQNPRFARKILIPTSEIGNACPGDLVVVKITQHPVQCHEVVGSIQQVLGREMIPGMETTLAIRSHEIPAEWPQTVMAQLHEEQSRFANVQMSRARIDLRDLPLLTIDGEDARDFDDAVFCQQSRRGWRLVVAIADVSHYVRVNSPMDMEAFARGNSVYFPNRVVPMLPEILSNNVCSLKPGEDRYCLACDMQISRKGNILDYEFYPALMRSKARLTYDEVASIVSDHDPKMRQKWSHICCELDHLFLLYDRLSIQRSRRGAISFEYPEPLMQFDEQQRISNITVRERNVAHKLIEECMLAANVCAAKLLMASFSGKGIYRNHAGPDPTTLSDLRLFLKGFGLYLSGGDSPTASDYCAVLAEAANKPAIFGTVQTIMLRSLGQAGYADESKGHFALSYPVYTHFTSPIRRYSDLVVHRLVYNILSGTSSRVVSDELSLAKVAANCSFTERRADDAVREALSWLKVEFMQDHIGAEFDGVVSGVKKFGIFVQLEHLFIDGLVHISTLFDDWYQFDSSQYTLTGKYSGRQFRLGDQLRVKVMRADMDLARVDFMLAEDSVGLQQRKGRKRSRHGRQNGRHAHNKANNSVTH